MTDTQPRLCLQDDHAAFDGHFPGDPALPGVVQLLFAEDAIRSAEGSEESAVAGLRRVRFRNLVRPAVAFSIDVTASGQDGQFNFVVQPEAEDAAAADGTFLMASRAPSDAARPAVDVPTATALPRPLDIEAILPHRGRALLLQQALRIAAPDSGEPSWLVGTVPAGSELIRDDRASVFAAIELVCQAGAVIPELQRPVDQPIRALEGALVGVREASFDASSFDASDRMFCAIRTETKASFMRLRAEIATGPSASSARALAAVDVKVLVRG